MQRPDVVIAVLLVAVLAFGAVYFVHIPTPTYFPLEHAWHLVEPGQGPGMGWYGRSGVALGISAVAALIAYAVMRRRRTSHPGLSRTTVRWLSAIILAALGLMTIAIVHEQAHWFTKPSVPLPAVHSDTFPTPENPGE